jgi:hypothetical protein
MSPRKVFISYSHDSRQHEKRVLALANLLRSDGIDAILDQYIVAPPEGWPLWMEKQIRDANFVLVICTETYLKRTMNEEQPGRGLGVRWEATISYQYLYNGSAINTKFIPVVFEENNLTYVPKPLQTTTYYLLNNKESYENLYQRLTDQFLPIPKLGEVKKISTDVPQQELENDLFESGVLSHITSTAGQITKDNLLKQESHYYVSRRQDREILRELRQRGITLTIKGPRKAGKTLLLRHALPKANQKYICIDFETIDDHVFDRTTAFYPVFCELIASELDIRSELQQSWKSSISASQQVTSFMEDQIFKLLKEPLIIAIDHADQLMGTDLSVDFFPMLRQWHNSRFKAVGWENITLVIVVSTDPKLLIEDDNESPFNVGTIIHLEDFSYDELIRLNSLYKNPLSAENLHQLYKLINGHPYLTRLAMDAVSSKSLEQSEMIADPLGIHTPFGAYMRSLRLKLAANPDLVRALRQIMLHEYPKKQSIDALLKAGIIQATNGQLEFRNNLYRMYFKDVL